MTRTTKETPFVKETTKAFNSPNIHWFNAPYCVMLAEQTKDIINASIYQYRGDALYIRTLCDVIAAIEENGNLTVETMACGWRVKDGWETAQIRIRSLDTYKEDYPQKLMHDLASLRGFCLGGAVSPFAQQVAESLNSDLVCYTEQGEMADVVASAPGLALVSVGLNDGEHSISPLFLNTLIESIHGNSPQTRVRRCYFFGKQGGRGWKNVILKVHDEESIKEEMRARRAEQMEKARQEPPSEERIKKMRKIRQILIDAGANPLLDRDPDEDYGELDF